MKKEFFSILAFLFLFYDLWLVFHGLEVLDLGYIIIGGWMFILGSATLFYIWKDACFFKGGHTDGFVGRDGHFAFYRCYRCKRVRREWFE